MSTLDPHAVLQADLAPRRLKEGWQDVESGRMSQKEFASLEQGLVDAYRQIWQQALVGEGDLSLKEALCRELAELEGVADVELVEQRCRRGVQAMKEEWEERVREGDEESVIDYYDQTENYSYELMWWHTLEEDPSPLAYVTALHLALRNGTREALDFGAGVGSGSLLFERHGIRVLSADVSSKLLDFVGRRLRRHGLEPQLLDLKANPLPPERFDFISAMDVLEHIAEPERTVEQLGKSLRPGGILFGRFASEEDEERPSHIARDFAPTFELLEELGYEECFRDEWLWGHQAFRKPKS